MSDQVIQASDTDYTFTMKIKSEPATEEEESPATTSQTIEHNCNEQHPQNQNHSPDNPITSLVKTEPPEHDPLEATYTNVRVRCLLYHKQLQSFRIIIS